MKREFIKELYHTSVEEEITLYKELFHCAVDNDRTNEFWKAASCFYKSLSEQERAVFFDILKYVITDAASGVLGIVDGSLLLDGKFDLNFTIDGEKMEGELQDLFWNYIEELDNNGK